MSDRAIGVLIALIDAHGKIVPVGDLLRDHGALPAMEATTAQALVSQLRRVLGDDRDLIETVPRRGYRLATEWYEIRDGFGLQTEVADALAAPAEPPPAAPSSPAALANVTGITHLTHFAERANGLSDRSGVRSVETNERSGTSGERGESAAARLLPLIGRDAELSELLMRVQQHRIVTLLGARGAGKTRLAREALPRTASRFGEHVYRVDLGGLILPGRVAQTLAAQLTQRADLAHAVETFAHTPALIAIDNADAVAPELAGVIETLLAGTRAHFIVCAEAPLFATGEYLLPLAPLRFASYHGDAFADTSAPSDAGKVFALQLRAPEPPQASGHTYADTHAFGDSHAPAFAQTEAIGRALSGNPLATQLAAAQIVARVRSGVTLAAALADWSAQFRAMLLRRNGAPDAALRPAEAVRAVIAFAYDALDANAQAAVRYLSLYAQPVAAAWIQARMTASEIRLDFEAFEAAVQAGLVIETQETLRAHDAAHHAAPASAGLAFDLHDAVRDFALAQCAARSAHDDYASAALLHAEWLCVRLAARDGEAPLVGQLRRALAWSFETGRLDLAARLLQASPRAWREAGLFGEQAWWIQRLLDHAHARTVLRVRDHMHLALALAQTRQYERPSQTSTEAAADWWRVYDLATACADDDTRLLALSVLLQRTLLSGFGDERPDLLAPVRERIARECEGASTHPGFTLMRGALMTLEGRHKDAIAMLAPASRDAPGHDLLSYGDASHGAHYITSIAHNALAISLWLTGARPQSHPVLREAMTSARRQSDPFARCAAAALGCVLSLVEDNHARLTQQSRVLMTVAKENRFAAWEALGRSFYLWTQAVSEASGSGAAAKTLIDCALRNLEHAHATLVDLLVLERFSAIAVRELGANALLRLYERMVAGLDSAGRRWLMPNALRVEARLRHCAGLPKQDVDEALGRAHDEALRQGIARDARNNTGP
ncbi:winged helix-turn-helix domain-containing protein [Paraburkholderia acidisoli]|uniref:OmpR/PhoB-type domain-containing protein n=1 Tax=Paraburkholderia acidisoli TaxID=2571748 RepID=A0A7Z2GQ01_9BURK|nr:winged helix-turn-helix domain-containing protein [Paraburkholderia acidisoli]QGZ65832.1 hypothetical protein FAZ98_28730 [Paraburkholderia acidisoli]